MAPIIFFRELIRNWRRTGSITPSSRALANAMVAHIDFSKARLIVELGPGTGPFTTVLLERMLPDAKLIVFELNPIFCEMLHKVGDPRLEIHEAPAADVVRVLGTAKADYILSGLPLAVLPPVMVEETLDAVAQSLSDDGEFVQFQYAVSAPAKGRIAPRFPKIETKTVLHNIPPARVYYSKR